MANIISGQIIVINPIQTIPSTKGGNPFIKREFVIRALRFNPNDGTPELSDLNTPIIEMQGQEACRVLDTFKEGDIVKVGFNIEGRCVKNSDGKVKFFNTVRGYSLEKLNVKVEANPKPKVVNPAGNAAGTGTAGTAAGNNPNGNTFGTTANEFFDNLEQGSHNNLPFD